MKQKINIDGILSFFILAATLYTDYIVYQANSLPFQWRIIAMVILSLIGLLLLAIGFKRFEKKGRIIRRIFTLLFILLFAFASINLDKVRIFTGKVTDVQDENTETISVIVKADSKIKNIEDLKKKTVYYQDGTDQSNGLFVKEKLAKEVNTIKFESENNYFTLASLLMNNEIDAMIITNSYIRSVEDGMEGFEAGIKTLKTYQRKVTKLEKEHTGVSLDLTQDTFTVLISGMDDTGDPNYNSRSDVNMVLLVNPKTNHIDMISFPRDSFVPNPALGNGNDKLTHCGNDGVENTMTAIEQVLGFEINFYVKVNFTSVVEMVDALGGITVNVPYAFCEQNSERSFAEEDLQCLEIGEQKLNGEQALAFARHRKSDGVGDIGRTHAQQKVIMAMIEKILTPSGASKVPELLDIVPKYVVTNVSDEQLNNFISYELENLSPWTMTSMTLENGSTGMLTTASMGNTPLSCYLLNQTDLETVWKKYWMMKNPTSFNEFSFDLNNLSPADMPNYSPSTSIVFYGNDISQYLGNEVVEEPITEDKPTQSTDDNKETNDIPEETPSLPNTPEDSNNNGGENTDNSDSSESNGSDNGSSNIPENEVPENETNNANSQ